LDQPEYFPSEAQADWLFGLAEAPDQSIWVSDSVTTAPTQPIGRMQHVDHLGKLLVRLGYANNVNTILYAADGALILAPMAGVWLDSPPGR
jgi:hypothetical protein